MNAIENLYYAVGEIAYAIAKSDGAVQKEEKKRFYSFLRKELEKFNNEVDVSEIIFEIMRKDDMDTETAYKWAMYGIRLNSHYLSPELKWFFLKVIEKVAAAYPPVTLEERNIIDKFRADIAPLRGNPLYYEQKINQD